MPRFIARLRETRVFRRYVHLPMSTHSYDEFIAACAAFPKPNPFPADWCITHVGDEHAYRLPPSIRRARSLADEDEWGLAISCPITAEASILIYAKNERAAILEAEKQLNAQALHRLGTGDRNGWNGYKHGGEVEMLSIRQDKTGKPLRHSFEIDVDQLVAPDRSWYPYEIDQIFEVFRDLAISGRDYHQQCTWHKQTHSHLLNGAGPNIFTTDELKPLLSLRDLKARFQYALLAQGYPFYAQWREDLGYQSGKTLKIETPFRGKSYSDIASGPIHTMSDALDQMLVQSRGMNLSWSLNNCHAGAIAIQAIGVSVSADGFAFVLRYGFPNETSYWHHTIASTRGNEPFAETLNRAYNLFLRLVPDFKEQHSARSEDRWRRARSQPAEPEYA